MSELDYKLLHLYRAAQEQTVAEFEGALFRFVEHAIPMSSAVLASVRNGPDGFIVYGMQLHNEPEAVADELPRVNRRYDEFIQRVLARPRVAYAALQRRLYPRPEEREMVEYIRRYGHANVMAVADTAHPQSPGIWLSVYRSREDHAFSNREQRMLTLLMPHISQAQWINQQSNGLREPFGSGDSAGSCAVATPQGRIIASTAGFVRLLREHWRDWCSARLPPDLFAALQSSDGRAWVSARGVAIACRSCAGHLFLRARLCGLGSVLSQREMQVGRLFAQGFGHKHVARELGLSPATVRNLLQRIYRKLQINSKIALARILRMEQYP